MTIQDKFWLFEKPVRERREENGCLAHLSDWQVHSAHIVAGDISSMKFGFQDGPLYVSMPTGVGKTTGAIWGMISCSMGYPDDTICFMTPYQASVDEVYSALVAELGADRVGRYHGDAGVCKEDELKKQIIVVTHQFLQANRGKLDDRDLFVIDEAILNTGSSDLKLRHIVEARDWALENDVCRDAFERFHSFAYEAEKRCLEGDNRHQSVLIDPEDQAWAKAIVGLNLSTYSQSISSMAVMSAVQKFCEAALRGFAFVSKGQQLNKGAKPSFHSAVFDIPNPKKTIVLSATARLSYDVVGQFREASGSRGYWTAPDYSNLTLTKLAGPEISGHYSTWKAPQASKLVQDYVDWLLQTVPEPSIYLTMPKSVVEGCLGDYLGVPADKNIVYPLKVEKYGKIIYVSHHAVGVGSNEFRDCEAVAYLWDNHVPQSVPIQYYHALSGNRITEEALDGANSGKVSDSYKDMREALYLTNMIQQIGRGRIRQFDERAVAQPMVAYVFTENPGRLDRLAMHYKGCKREDLCYQGQDPAKPKGQIQRVLNYVRDYSLGRSFIPATEVEGALGFEIRRLGETLGKSHDLSLLGFEYVKGRKGRGNAAAFKAISGSQFDLIET
jgi:hypothetical protein